MTNEEIMTKAKGAKSAEELLKIAHENGMEDFTEESAKAYFDLLNKSGEIADDELENASGGGCYGLGSSSRLVTTILNSCKYYRCHWCNTTGERRYELMKFQGWTLDVYPWARQLHGCDRLLYDPEDQGKHNGKCNSCFFCSYESGIWYCNAKERMR